MNSTILLENSNKLYIIYEFQREMLDVHMYLSR